MYVQDNIRKWVEEYKPDKNEPTIETIDGETNVKGHSFVFGNIIVSVQWGLYNYCDHYDNGSYYSGWMQPSATNRDGSYRKTTTAEIAIIFLGRYEHLGFGELHNCFVKFNGYDPVKGFAEIPIIDIILRDCAAYARA